MIRPAALLFTAILLPATLLADGEKPLSSKVTGAKVFLTGAQVSRSAGTTIPAGSSTLVFTGLPQALDPQSIQVTGKGGYNILSVNSRVNYLTESPKKKEIEDLQTRIKQYEHDWNTEKGLQQVWENEEQLLQKNASIGGQNVGITAAQLQAVNDYVRERLKAVKAGWWAEQEKMTAIGTEADKLRAQLAQLQAQAPRPTSEVVVEIESSAEVNATFALTYFVPGASWTPAYDLRAKSVGQPIDLLMKAEVVNNTGEDWTKVDLSLSSGDPTRGGVMPQLQAWVLDQPIYRTQGLDRRYKATADDESRAPAMAPMAANGYYDSTALEEKQANGEVANSVVYNTTTLEFAIDAPFSIPADGVAHTVGVRSQTIPATYLYYSTPKLDKDAFLYARTTGWEDLDLLPGQANVFFEGTFVGQSYLDLSRPQDTLNISLGRDKGVVVERVRRKGTDDKAIVGGKRTVTRGWDITVRNTKSIAIDLEVRDQYPISPRSEIEVKLEDKGGAAVNEQTGILTWKLNIAPKESKKLGFTYSVKHPKDQPVIVE